MGTRERPTHVVKGAEHFLEPKGPMLLRNFRGSKAVSVNSWSIIIDTGHMVDCLRKSLSMSMANDRDDTVAAYRCSNRTSAALAVQLRSVSQQDRLFP